MPRTPLLRALSRLAEEHQSAQALGIEPAALHELRAREGYSRREFVRRAAAAGALAAGGSALLSERAAAAHVSPTNPRIAIVGAGIAGLSAALTLADAGIASTVYEASPTRLGGRMHSDSPLVSGGDNYFQGQVAEYCGEFIDSNHQTILGLVKRFDLTASDVLSAQPPMTTETYYFQGGYYPYSQASSDFQPVHNTLQGQMHAAGYPTLWNSYNAAGQALDELSLYEWIEQYVPGGHGSDFGRLLDVAYNEEYGADTSDQSSLNLVYLLGSHAKPGKFQIYGASDERFHIAGGNQQLPETIASYVEGTGLVSIVPGSFMNEIVLNTNGTVSLTFRGVHSPVVYDQVILCMSFAVLRTLGISGAGFDQLKQTAINQLGAGRNAKLQLQFTSRLWNQSGPWGSSNGDVYTDIGFQNTWEVTRAQAGSAGILSNYTGGSVAGGFAPSTPYSNASNNSQVTTYSTAYLKQLETVFPGITALWTGRAILSTPFRDPNLLLAYSYWKVGQYTQFSGYEKVAQGPNQQIHFAGEHCSQDFQGYMEGGAEEGIRAAGEILTALGI